MNLTLVGERQILRLLYPEADKIQALRPKTRAECENAQRPCPWVGCRHHLYLTVDEKTGAITENFPGIEVWEMSHTCALDVGGEQVDGMSLEELGSRTMLTRERTRQIEMAALANMRDEVGSEPPKPGLVPIRSRQHRRVSAAIVRLCPSMLRIARMANSTPIRTFVASLEQARGLPNVVQVISQYLAEDPQLDARAITALRAIACAAAEQNPMAWPVHLLDATRALDQLDAAINPGPSGTIAKI